MKDVDKLEQVWCMVSKKVRAFKHMLRKTEPGCLEWGMTEG